MGPIGMQEMMVITLLALVLFGPKKLPELFRTFGKAMAEFQRARNDLKATLDREMSSLEKEHAELKQVTREYTNEIYNSYDSYDHHEYDAGAYGSEPYPAIAETNPSTVSATALQGADSQQDAHSAPAAVASHVETIEPVRPEGTIPVNGHPHGEPKAASDVHA